MQPRSFLFALSPLLFAASLSANDWTNWRGPLQNGVSLEHYTGAGKLADAPAWTYAARSRGTPVICDGKVILWGYKGETSDLIELLTCLDAKTGAKLWEHELPDYLSDSIYNRYSCPLYTSYAAHEQTGVQPGLLHNTKTNYYQSD